MLLFSHVETKFLLKFYLFIGFFIYQQNWGSKPPGQNYARSVNFFFHGGIASHEYKALWKRPVLMNVNKYGGLKERARVLPRHFVRAFIRDERVEKRCRRR